MRGRDLPLHAEPALRELLDDPVMQAVMRRDHVAPNDILDLVLDMRERLGAAVAAETRAAA